MTRCEPRKKLVPLPPTRPFSTKSHPIESRISFVPLVFSLLFCLSACNVGTTAWAQSQGPRHGNNDTPGQPVRLRESIHVDVDERQIHIYMDGFPQPNWLARCVIISMPGALRLGPRGCADIAGGEAKE